MSSDPAVGERPVNPWIGKSNVTLSEAKSCEKLMFGLEYVAFSISPSSDIEKCGSKPCVNRSEDELIVDRGGEWSAIMGSVGLITYAEVAVVLDGSIAVDMNGRLNEVVIFGTCVDSPAMGMLNIEGLANSDGDAVVVADIGFARTSIPYSAEVSMRRVGADSRTD